MNAASLDYVPTKTSHHVEYPVVRTGPRIASELFDYLDREGHGPNRHGQLRHCDCCWYRQDASNAKRCPRSEASSVPRFPERAILSIEVGRHGLDTRGKLCRATDPVKPVARRQLCSQG